MSFTMSFNNTILPIRISKVEGRGPLTQEVYRKSNPGSPGSYYQKRRIPERPLAVNYSFTSKGLVDNRRFIDNLNSLLYVPAPVPISFSDEPHITYYGILNGEQDWDEGVLKSKGVLSIICPAPYKYGAEKTVTSTTITNEGTAESTPIMTFTFTAAASELKASHQNGKYVRVIWNFVVGDKLIIDTATRKITINNNVRMTALDFKSNWFGLMPGSNKLTISPNVATISTKFRPRWL